MTDRVEFFCDDETVASVDSSHAPDRGDKVNIRRATYVVIGRTYTVDYSDLSRPCRDVCCVINLRLATEEDD